jgi:hypothetical protein
MNQMTEPTERIESVPLLDFQRVTEGDKARLREAFARVLDSGYFILGPEVAAFRPAPMRCCSR